MAATIETLTAIRDNIMSQLDDLSANPKPDYSIDGQTVSWSTHMKNLIESLDKINSQLDREAGPVEEVSVVIP